MILIIKKMMVVSFMFLLVAGNAYSEGLEQLLERANMGDTKAQIELGGMYFEGQNISQNHKESVKWYTRAAKQGDDWSIFRLGLLSAKGQGISAEDFTEFVAWYTELAENGNQSAKINLATMYEHEGVLQNYGEALKWFQIAAEQANGSALFSLGNMYYEGKGVLQDYVMAYTLWNISATKGNDRSKKSRDEILNKMTHEQIAKGQKLSNDLFDKYGKDLDTGKELNFMDYLKEKKGSDLYLRPFSKSSALKRLVREEL